MRIRSIAAIAIAMMSFPFSIFAATTQDASYRYNRIAENIEVLGNGDVHVQDIMTMLYDGSFSSMWITIPATSTVAISDITMLDGSTGEPFTYSATSLDSGDSDSWGKFTHFVDNGLTNVQWYYNTSDRVHTWVLSYTLHGAVTYYPDHDELSIPLFKDYDAPVDTVEATVHLPAPVTAPQSQLSTSGGHDFYIDRPDKQTFRFRVSDINSGETVKIRVGWQKGMVHPKLLLAPIVMKFASVRTSYIAIALAVIILIAALVYVEYRYRYARIFFKRSRKRS